MIACSRRQMSFGQLSSLSRKAISTSRSVRSLDSPVLIPTTSSSGCRLNVTLSAWASRKEHASAVQTAVPALGNYI
jgi:hypothetical protein